jgi:hypothetical protein
VAEFKNCQHRILYPAKISLRDEREIQTSLDEQKLENLLAAGLPFG